MKSAASFFNTTIFKKNTSRFWPIWAAYLAILIIAIPLSISSRVRMKLQYSEVCSVTVGRYLLDTVTSSFFFGLLFVACCAAAVASFSYLYSSRSVSMTASLPIKRNGLFLTSCFSGLIWLFAGQVICAVITAIAELTMGVFSMGYILQWLAISFMAILFFYGLAVFCAMLTGMTAVSPFIYGLLNFAAIILEFLMTSLLSLLLYGMPGNFGHHLLSLSPILKMCSYEPYFISDGINLEFIDSNGQIFTGPTYEQGSLPTGQFAKIGYSGWLCLAIYCAVGIALIVAALFIHKRRRMESAGDTVSINFLKPVFKYCITFAASLALGIILYQIIFNYTTIPALPAIIACSVIAGAIGYFASEMVIRKTFRVFKKWRGLVIYSVIIVVLLMAVDFDLFGYERKIPSPDSIHTVYLRCSGGGSMSIDNEALFPQITALHKSIVENKQEHERAAALPGRNTVLLRFDYSMDDGSYMERSYSIAADPDIVKLEEMWNSYDFKLARYSPSVEVREDTALGAYFRYYDENNNCNEIYLTPQEAYEFYTTCITADLKDTSLGAVQLHTGNSIPTDYEYHEYIEKYPQTANVDLGRYYCEFYFVSENSGYATDIFSTNSESVSIDLTSDAVRSVKFLDDLIHSVNLEERATPFFSTANYSAEYGK